MARRGIEKLRADVALVRKVEHGRHIDEIGQRREIKFTDPQWKRIAAEMPGMHDADKCRHGIEIAAAWLAHRRQNPELAPGHRAPKRDKGISERIETAALNLSLALDELSGFSRMRLEGMFGAGRQGEAFVDRSKRLASFKADVDRIAGCAPFFLKGEQPDGLGLEGNADQARILAWANAADWWEHATGKEATANLKSQGSASRAPTGPFVRFLQAFSAAIPGEPVPTGWKVNHFVRTYLDNGKKSRFQLGRW